MFNTSCHLFTPDSVTKKLLLYLFLLGDHCEIQNQCSMTYYSLNQQNQSHFSTDLMFHESPAQRIIVIACVLPHRKWWGMRFRWWTSSTMSTSFSFTPPSSHAMTSSWWWSSKRPHTCCSAQLWTLICAAELTMRSLQCGGRGAVWPHHRRELQPDRAGHGAVHPPDLWGPAVHAQDVHPAPGPQGKALLSV